MLIRMIQRSAGSWKDPSVMRMENCVRGLREFEVCTQTSPALPRAVLYDELVPLRDLCFPPRSKSHQHLLKPWKSKSHVI